MSATIIGVRIDGHDVAFDRVSSTIGLVHGRTNVDDGPLASSASLMLVNVTKPLLPNEVAPVNGDFADGLAGLDLTWGFSTARIVDGACELTKGATDPDSWNDGIYRVEWPWDGSRLTIAARLKVPPGLWVYVQPGAYDAAHASTGPTPYIDVEGTGAWQEVALDWTPRADTVVVDIGVYCYPTNPKQNGVGEPVTGGPPGTRILIDDVVLAPVGQPFPVGAFRVGVELELDHSGGAAFRGRLTDAKLEGDTLALTAIGPLATIARRTVGVSGFPAQLWADRVRTVFAEAGASDVLELELGAWNPPLVAAEPESSTLGTVLQSLAEDMGAAIADRPDGRVLVQTIEARAPVLLTVPFPWEATAWRHSGHGTLSDDGGAYPWTYWNMPARPADWGYMIPLLQPTMRRGRYRLTIKNVSYPVGDASYLIVVQDAVTSANISAGLAPGGFAWEFDWANDTTPTGAMVIIYQTTPPTIDTWIAVSSMKLERIGEHADPIVLPPETVVYAPAWTMIDDVANVLALDYAGDQTLTRRDESSVAEYEARPASLSTELATFDDAERRALEFLNRRARPDWVVSSATVLARVPVAVGKSASLTMLPPSSPSPEYLGVIEGWTDSIEAGEWTTTLALSSPRLSGLGVRWRDPDEAWNEAGAATWYDPSALGAMTRLPFGSSASYVTQSNAAHESRMEPDAR